MVPQQIYLNKTKIAQLLVSQSDTVLQQLKPWFDKALIKRESDSIKYMYALSTMREVPALKRILQDFDAATHDPDGTLAQRFLRDLYQVVYYMYGDEKSGLKQQDIQDDKTFDKLTDFRIKYFGDFNQKLEHALNSKTIGLVDFAILAHEYTDMVENNPGAVQDDKLKGLIEEKLFDVANAAIKKVDLSPMGMANQKSNFEAISVYVKMVLDGLYPMNNDHKSEIEKNWLPEAIAKRVLEVQGIKKPAQKDQTPQDEVQGIKKPAQKDQTPQDDETFHTVGEDNKPDAVNKEEKLKKGKNKVWEKLFPHLVAVIDKVADKN